jgi:hypothetical protein
LLDADNAPANMNEQQHRFLCLLGELPARLDVQQAGLVLNFQPHDIPVLVTAGLLKPLGTPQANSVKYFATVDVLERGKDRTWLNKATITISRHWQRKNAKKIDRQSGAHPVPPCPEPTFMDAARS